MLKILTVILFGQHQVLTEIVSGCFKFISGIYRNAKFFIGIVSGCLGSISGSYWSALNLIWIFIGMFENHIRNLSGCSEFFSGLYRDAFDPCRDLIGVLYIFLDLYRDA